MITSEEGEELYVTPMLGRVIDNHDPKGLCRVQVFVQALFDDEDEGSPWARPMGMSGVNTGVWNPPKVGSQVLVLFKAGDPDKPWYIRAQHTTGERPEYVQRAIDESPSEKIGEVTAGIHTFETDTWEVTCDEREGRKLFRARAKGLGSQDPVGSSLMVEMDFEQGVLGLSAPAGIGLFSDGRIVIESPDLIIGGRRVVQGVAKVI